VDPVRGLDLEALARATGGTYVDPAQFAAGRINAPAPFDPAFDDSGSLTATRLWPGLLLAALFLYLAEIAWRRWPRAIRGAAA
jgi:hypothetical protein